MVHCLRTADCHLRKRRRKPTSCHPASAAYTILMACSTMIVVCAHRPTPYQVSSAAPLHHPSPAIISKAITINRVRLRQMLDVGYVDTLCFINGSGLSQQRAKLSRSARGFFHGGVMRRLDSEMSASAGRDVRGGMAVMMGTTRAKRTGGRGRPIKTHGVAKKFRRILEPASQAELAYEVKKEKVSMMNWGKLGKAAGQSGRGRGRGAGEGSETADAGLEAAWKDTTLPIAGDLLQCKHFKVCPGCEFDRRFEETPIMVDSSSFMDNLHAAAARKRGGSTAALDFQPHVVHGWDPHAWRTMAKLAAKPVSKWGGVELGLYMLGSHDVVGIPECRVHHPSVNRAVELLQASAKKIGITGFRPENMDGDLRYVQLVVERSSGQVQLTLVWNEECYRDATPKLQLLAKDLRSAAPDLFHSIWANFRVGGGNVIFSRDPHSWHRCSGPEYLKEVIGPDQVPFFFSPPLFRQANMDHFERIVEAVVDWVPEGSAVCELYAGVGVLGLNCASKARLVRCSDVNSFNPRSFERSRRSLPEELQERVSFLALSAEDAIEGGEAEECEVLIVDPPRKGLDRGVLDALCDPEDPNTADLRRVIYVSCGFDALKRDTLTLLGAGWALRHTEGFVLFPGTDHVETLVIYDR